MTQSYKQTIKNDKKMKRIYVTLLTVIMVVSLSAQNRVGQPRGYLGANPVYLMPTLTPEQSATMTELRIEFEKEVIQYQNKLQELNAQLRTLQLTERSNTKAINSKIDEITALQNKFMKLRTAHHARVRELLTDEQKVEFDRRVGPHGYYGMQRGMRGPGAYYQNYRGSARGIAPRNVRGGRGGGFGPGYGPAYWLESEVVITD